ncbi:MAG: hypothetical protein PHI23_04735, partial [Candidatus Peribacteraceae bacterium]|nr:hypothetical protein [Candidatus Peribacteraceae bacterium]
MVLHTPEASHWTPKAGCSLTDATTITCDNGGGGITIKYPSVVTYFSIDFAYASAGEVPSCFPITADLIVLNATDVNDADNHWASPCETTCGNGVCDSHEDIICPGTGGGACSVGTCPSDCPGICGDGQLNTGEQCEDGVNVPCAVTHPTMPVCNYATCQCIASSSSSSSSSWLGCLPGYTCTKAISS